MQSQPRLRWWKFPSPQEVSSHVPCSTRTCHTFSFPPVPSPRVTAILVPPSTLSFAFSWPTHNWDNRACTLAPGFFPLAHSLWDLSILLHTSVVHSSLILCRNYTIVGFSFFLPSLIDGYLGYFQFVAILSKAAMTFLYKSLDTFPFSWANT